MSLLYKDKEDITTFVDIKNVDGVIKMLFSNNGGKFGTSEILDEYYLTPERLLEILQDRNDYTDKEI